MLAEYQNRLVGVSFGATGSDRVVATTPVAMSIIAATKAGFILAKIRATTLTTARTFFARNSKLRLSGTTGQVELVVTGGTSSGSYISNENVALVNRDVWIVANYDDNAAGGSKVTMYAVFENGVVEKLTLGTNTDPVGISSDATSSFSIGNSPAATEAFQGIVYLAAMGNGLLSPGDIQDFTKNLIPWSMRCKAFFRPGLLGKSIIPNEAGLSVAKVYGVFTFGGKVVQEYSPERAPDYPDLWFRPPFIILATNAGSSTPTGIVTLIRVLVLSGSTTPSSDLGIVPPSGLLPVGTTTPVGALTELVIGMNDGRLEGFVSSSGSLLTEITQYVTPLQMRFVPTSGTLILQLNKLFVGTVTPTGAVIVAQQAIEFAGTTTPTGSVITTKFTISGGTSSDAGSFRRRRD